MAFLPVTKKETEMLGWDAPDFVLVTGDAYVDHPSFGTAIISRVLENAGYRVAILSQPDWHTDRDFMRFGRPKLGFMINAGNIDSMVAHYTAAKKKRSTDAYSPGNKMGKRPDRAVIVYSKKVKGLYPDCPVIIGGLEASLRRFAHYDYWDDAVRPSILLDSGADLLSFGMGEKQTIEIADRLRDGKPVSSLRDIRGTCYLIPTREYQPGPAVDCPSFEQVSASKKEYAVAARKQQEEQDAVTGRKVLQKHGSMLLVQNPPMPMLTREEMDAVYALPYERTYHPSYEKQGGVPAIQEVEFSITHNRGCFGACNFCSIAFHQGRMVTSRSEESILAEAKLLTEKPNFKGYIHDVGGPTADLRHNACLKQEDHGVCRNRKCLAPRPCGALAADHAEYLQILRKLRNLPKVKKVFIRSGIRFDYLMEDPDDTFFRELVEHHVSGQLKVAPEHCSANVLDHMGKPHIETYKRFQKKFYQITKEVGKEQYLVPYLMSSHPGSDLRDAIELALFLKQEKLRPEQVQDFYPTPGTISTCMFYTEMDPYTLKKVFVPKSDHDKALQRALLQYFDPKNHSLVVEALRKAGRHDLIGTGPNCLVPPPRGKEAAGGKKETGRRSGPERKPGKGGNRSDRNRKNGHAGRR